ncbi:glycyl-radical enzyme activating protein [Sedimentibacter hydroxybenzoicus DSM 7310]|uniref:Glycyl-radical enzyme activating protein n=1 Tax=Sedimentibacter hydroxybenzoicus DSM 7310 TaxID=1123245 RepID=A0A974BMP7_SEDHY|nr:trans-4-hydroxy-L-proline dehydratase activase [Sedimentibacter hydroxybenzoicus]NYB75676.1 glycyl-radical enzyme activating protein [Sedimentibacter hydroxybenzoicus DSM 7310]
MNTVAIFNIQKFSIHDGPGIRTTVFLKGCPLKCLWCHNPESQEYEKQILYDAEKCVLCGTCVKVCPKNAIKIEGNILTTDMDKCDFCGLCEIYCIQEARQVVGKHYSVEEVLKEVLKDRIFYEKSGGGVTVSGGEPLMFIDFVEELFKKLKEENIHTAVDTSGAVNFESLERIAEYTDLFLYDIKLMDDEIHKKYIKASNKTILDNLKKLSKIHNNINIRLPIIEGVNADTDHIERIIDFIKDLNIKKVNLLPYHDIAKHKYKKLDMDYEEENMSKPSEEKMQRFMSMFESKGYEVKIGG